MKKKAGILIYTCIFVFAAFGPAIAEYRLPDTGQTMSYYSEGNIITCQNTDQPLYGHEVSNNGSDPVYLSKGAGTQKWAFQAGDDVNSSPAIGSDGTVYVGSYDKKVYALNPNGTKKWDFQTGDKLWASPAIAPDGTIYVGSRNGKVYALNPNGTKKWDFLAGTGTWSSPAIGPDGTIYVGSWDKKLYAINPNGTKKWSFLTGGAVDSSPAIGMDGTIYVGSYDNKVYAINPNGTQKWAFTTGNGVFSSPAIGPDGTIYVGSWDKKVYAINPNGTKKWAFTTGSIVLSSPAIGADGTIYVGSEDSKLYAINPNGTQKWAFTTGSWVDSSPAIGTDGTIYVGSWDSKVYAINPNGTKKWEFTTGGSVDSSPAIGPDGTIYVGSKDNKVYAIEGNSGGLADSSWPMYRHDLKHRGSLSGIQKWSFLTGNLVNSSPAIGSDGTIYVGSSDKKVYAINPNGTKKWEFLTGNFVFSSPAIGADGTVYVGSSDNKVYAINPNGTKKWEFPATVGMGSSPAIGPDGTIYVGSSDNKVYAINPNGTQKWAFMAGDSVFSSPAIGSDGTIYIGSNDDKVYAINPDGTQKWAFQTGGNVVPSPAIGSDGTIYAGSLDDKVYAINPNGTKKWSFLTGADLSASAAIGPDGTIYVGSTDKKVYAINPNGTKKWEFLTGDFVDSSPAIGSDGTIYVGSWDNKVYAINPNGTQKWAFLTGDNVFSSPAIGPDGTIYVGSLDRRVYALESDSGGLADSSWPMYRHDLKHTANLALPKTSAPTFNPDGGAHTGTSVSVTISCATAGATIRYTTNGSEPTESSSTVVSGGTVSMPVPGTLKARAYKTSMNPSDIKTADYTSASKVATPAFSPDGGAHSGTSVNVTVNCATAGATIRYTTNGSEPTESSSTVASGGTVSVPLPGTLKAKAWKTGMNPSNTKSASYTAASRVATPAFNPDGGEHSGSSVNVTVSCATAGATIRYTTNGSEPTESSPTVASGGTVPVPLPGKLKAKAWKTGMTPSEVKSAVYLVSGTPVINIDGGWALTSGLWARAILQVPGNPVTLVWQEVGTDITPSGDQVISGYFYADPKDFAYGSRYNPEVFVKIYITKYGWCNIAFNHVTVDYVTVYSAHNYAGAADKTGSVTLDSRLAEHQYNGVSIDISKYKTYVSNSLIVPQWILNSISFLPLSNAKTLRDGGYDVTPSLWTKAILQVANNPVTLVWQEVGTDITPSGDQVISGYFYADPKDFAYGSRYNPEVFVKIYITKYGWCNIAFNHVTVDDVAVYSAHNYAGAAGQTGSVNLNSRLAEHQYNGVSIYIPTNAPVNSQGGIITVPLDDPYIPGVSLKIPQGALDSETKITIQGEPPEIFSSKSPRETAISEPSLYISLIDYAIDNLESEMIHPMYGPLFLLNSAQFTGPGIKMGPDNQQFNTPVTLTAPLSVLGISSSDITAMPLLYSSDGIWEVPQNFGFDQTKFTVEIPHFSITRYIKNFGVFVWNFNDIPALVQNAQSIILQDTFMQAVIEVVCSGTEPQTTLNLTNEEMDEWQLLWDLYYGATPGTTVADQNALINWIQAQDGQVPDNSITLAQLFSKALEQQNGNIYKALATVHGVLCFHRGRAYLNKLIEKPITDNDPNKDQAGPRYHFFGAALHAFVHEYGRDWLGWTRYVPGLQGMQDIQNLLSPDMILQIEEGIVSGDIISEPHEYAFDLKGAEFGRDLYRKVQGKTRDEIISSFNIDPSVVCPGSTICEWMDDENVLMNWYDANDYCAAKGGRLPTDTEFYQAWMDGGFHYYPDLTPGFLNWRYWTCFFYNDSSARSYSLNNLTGYIDDPNNDYNIYVRCIKCP